MIELPFGQTLEWFDLATILLLIVLEGVLSIDNALVLGILAKRLPEHQRKRALTYGLVGAFVFRAVAIVMASYLLQWKILKLFGGGYLAFVALKYFVYEMWSDEEEHIALDSRGEPILVDDTTGEELDSRQYSEELEARTVVPVDAIAPITQESQPSLRRVANGKSIEKFARFWPTVVVIELTDLAFAVDSILAALALISTKQTPGSPWNPKLWVVFLGGILGVVLMRVAAVIFIRMLEKFPRFEVAAYLLVFVISAKLIVDWYFNSGAISDPRFDFHAIGSPAFLIFWISMAISFMVGFIRKTAKQDGQ